MGGKWWFVGALAALILAAAPAAHAQADPQRTALAQELVQLMDVQPAMEDLFVAMTPAMAAQIATESRLSEQEQSRLADILAEEFRAALPDLVTTITQLYADSMSAEELTQTLAFMRSPAGQAWLSVENRTQQQLEDASGALGERVGMRAVDRLLRETRGRSIK